MCLSICFVHLQLIAQSHEVQDITLKNGLGAQYGPFANTVPVRREDGVFDSISFKRYDKLKDKGKIVRNIDYSSEIQGSRIYTCAGVEC